MVYSISHLLTLYFLCYPKILSRRHPAGGHNQHQSDCSAFFYHSVSSFWDSKSSPTVHQLNLTSFQLYAPRRALKRCLWNPISQSAVTFPLKEINKSEQLLFRGRVGTNGVQKIKDAAMKSQKKNVNDSHRGIERKKLNACSCVKEITIPMVRHHLVVAANVLSCCPRRDCVSCLTFHYFRSELLWCNPSLIFLTKSMASSGVSLMRNTPRSETGIDLKCSIYKPS